MSVVQSFLSCTCNNISSVPTVLFSPLYKTKVLLRQAKNFPIPHVTVKIVVKIYPSHRKGFHPKCLIPDQSQTIILKYRCVVSDQAKTRTSTPKTVEEIQYDKNWMLYTIEFSLVAVHCTLFFIYFLFPLNTHECTLFYSNTGPRYRFVR